MLELAAEEVRRSASYAWVSKLAHVSSHCGGVTLGNLRAFLQMVGNQGTIVRNCLGVEQFLKGFFRVLTINRHYFWC